MEFNCCKPLIYNRGEWALQLWRATHLSRSERTCCLIWRTGRTDYLKDSWRDSFMDIKFLSLNCENWGKETKRRHCYCFELISCFIQRFRFCINYYWILLAILAQGARGIFDTQSKFYFCFFVLVWQSVFTGAQAYFWAWGKRLIKKVKILQISGVKITFHSINILNFKVEAIRY